MLFKAQALISFFFCIFPGVSWPSSATHIIMELYDKCGILATITSRDDASNDVAPIADPSSNSQYSVVGLPET